MEIKTIFCDICGYKFKEHENWDSAPVKVDLNLSHPRQTYESTSFPHVCYHCVESIKSSFEKTINDIKISKTKI